MNQIKSNPQIKVNQNSVAEVSLPSSSWSRLLAQAASPPHNWTRIYMASNAGKKLIQIDVSSDTVCPWCFVGKKNLEKAMEQNKDKFDFEVRWHPFFLNPNAPKEGIKKSDYYRMKFGPIQFEHATARMTEVNTFEQCKGRVCSHHIYHIQPFICSFCRYLEDLGWNMTCLG
ncbi:Os03g0598900 [Oryza sativa Japonica Group]|uniref:Os03g0598900 protein n=1 Tax=Oryza sativa subsp. japonica TaxID=39947 RepID=Q0DQG1_ORYSJ|nr:Os03g0598900 [Oryza sativa Japonica Group]|eukprot:NP_001050613.2 Os03g0598900 [Oryza sativa Japonica Group]